MLAITLNYKSLIVMSGKPLRPSSGAMEYLNGLWSMVVKLVTLNSSMVLVYYQFCPAMNILHAKYYRNFAHVATCLMLQRGFKPKGTNQANPITHYHMGGLDSQQDCGNSTFKLALFLLCCSTCPLD